MTMQICPQCRQANELNSRYCARCGGPLAIEHIPSQHRSLITVGNGSLLPAPSMRQVGRAVAVSLVALAAEVGIILLRRRVAQMGRSVEKPIAVVPRSKEISPAQNAIVSKRIVQFWRKGRLSGQLVEHSVYQDFE